ncbi:hypothetical protein [Nocardioides montaniterrae]
MSRRPVSRIVAALVVAVLATGAAGCGSGPSHKKPAASASPTVPPYLPVPDGVALTAPGTALRVGQHAVVAWRPRQNSVAVLDLRVRRIERTTYDRSFQGWAVGKDMAATTPYFARVTVKNVSDTDLGGLPVPLYGQDDGGRFTSAQPFAQRTFVPCHPSVLPKPFAPGAIAELCFVYAISPGHDLASIAFNLQQDNTPLKPVTWTGKPSDKIIPPKPKPTAKAGKKAGKKTTQKSGKKQ